MCDAVCHARKYVVPSETEILLEPNISCMVNTAFIQDVVTYPKYNHWDLPHCGGALDVGVWPC